MVNSKVQPCLCKDVNGRFVFHIGDKEQVRTDHYLSVVAFPSYPGSVVDHPAVDITSLEVGVAPLNQPDETWPLLADIPECDRPEYRS